MNPPDRWSFYRFCLSIAPAPSLHKTVFLEDFLGIISPLMFSSSGVFVPFHICHYRSPRQLLLFRAFIPQAIILITQGENLPLPFIGVIVAVINDRRTGLFSSCV